MIDDLPRFEKFARRDGIMPVGKQSPARARSKETARDRRKTKAIGRAMGGVRKRRQRQVTGD